MKRLLVTIFSILFLTGVAKAEWKYGFSVMAGQLSTDGTESEKSGSVGPETNSKSIDETFAGASLFVEYILDSGITVGLDYVPLDLELGSGKRTDSTTDGNESTDDSGTYSASADVTDLMTLYVNYPLGTGGYYGSLGAHQATVTTSETLPNSTYGNDDIYGVLVGLGYKAGPMKLEVAYSDFETIGVSSSSGSSSVSADADALNFKIAYSF